MFRWNGTLSGSNHVGQAFQQSSQCVLCTPNLDTHIAFPLSIPLSLPFPSSRTKPLLRRFL